MWSDWVFVCDCAFSLSALWCPLSVPTLLLGLAAGAGVEELPHVQGQGRRLHFAGAAMKRYPTSKVRETQVRQQALWLYPLNVSGMYSLFFPHCHHHSPLQHHLHPNDSLLCDNPVSSLLSVAAWAVLSKSRSGAFLVVQWLTVHLPVQTGKRSRVRYLTWEGQLRLCATTPEARVP